LSKQFLKYEKDEEAKKLYEHVAERMTPSSKEWFEAQLKLGDINARKCSKMISDEEFQQSELDKIVISATSEPKMKTANLISMFFSDAQEHYHEFVQKTLRKLQDICNLEKKDKAPQERFLEVKSRIVDELIDVVAKRIVLDKEFYGEAIRNAPQGYKNTLGEQALSHARSSFNVLSSAFAIFGDTDRLDSKFLIHMDTSVTQLDDYNRFIVSLLGLETTATGE